MGFREDQRRGVADERRQVFAERRGVGSEEGSCCFRVMKTRT